MTQWITSIYLYVLQIFKEKAKRKSDVKPVTVNNIFSNSLTPIIHNQFIRCKKKK